MSVTIRQRGAPVRTGTGDGLHRAAISLRGVAAIALGIFAMARPALADVLIVIFAAFAILDGVLRIVVALRSTGNDKAWLLHALEGVVSIAAGVVVFRVARSLIGLTWTVAEWAFAIGALTVIFAIVAWRRLKDAVLWLLGGVLLIALGAALLWVTFGGLLAPGYALGVFGLIYGALSLFIGIRAHHNV